ncbi:hypothetical protein Bca52824_026842 [Brassica carinata]|uniref:Legumain prodomain domain-containing protein n=1 Tax=Brassica carinata TaxID=52824 RepID=A0A8X7V967_BRACI|nr:hypothetical protein Bca52824_026842 [Brassica carinata]
MNRRMMYSTRSSSKSISAESLTLRSSSSSPSNSESANGAFRSESRVSSLRKRRLKQEDLELVENHSSTGINGGDGSGREGSVIRCNLLSGCYEESTREEHEVKEYVLEDLARQKKQHEEKEAQRLAMRRLERERGRREATADMSEEFSEGEKGDLVIDVSTHGTKARLPRINWRYKKAPEGSARKAEAQKQFLEAMSHRLHVDNSVLLIGRLLFGISQGPVVLNKVRGFEKHCGSLSQYGFKHMRSIQSCCLILR